LTRAERVPRGVAAFLGTERLSLGPWQAIERNLQRLFVHQGAEFADRVGRSGDGGADVIGFLRGDLWVVQTKYRGSGQLVDRSAVDEVVRAAIRYEAERAVVACTTGFTRDAIDAARASAEILGRPVHLWDRDFLESLAARLSEEPAGGDDPRPYQDEAIDAFAQAIATGRRRGLLLMATGLGKTRVAAGVIRRWLEDRPRDEILVLAPGLELVDQLEESLWPYLPKSVPTHVMTGQEKPTFSGGVVISTLQSMRNVAADNARRFGLVVVDEAHHAPSPRNRETLELLGPRFLMGMTATPWRSDRADPSSIFGESLFTASIVEGIRGGYLADVDYEMFVDDIDWDWVNTELGQEKNLTVRDLNRLLFVPERDEEVVRRITTELARVPGYRCLIYTRSIEHADRFSALLAADGLPASALHSGLDRFDRAIRLNRFRRRGGGILVTVDMLNEGIDVPQVNVVVFLRVTHSRTLFLQQLGRGLRVAPGKTRVRVLDFVSDIRRIAAGIDLNDAAVDEWGRPRPEPKDAYVLKAGRVVNFSSERSVDFVRSYLADVADLQDSAENAVLRFPGPIN
jgi:superfamily II DNA or RNA helicase